MTRRIAVSLPDDVVAAARQAVADGRAASVSAFVAGAIEEHGRYEQLSVLLSEMAPEARLPTQTGRGRSSAVIPASNALLDEAHVAGADLAVPAGVVARAWCGDTRDARPVRFPRLATVTVVPLDEPEARAAGALYGHAGTADVVDASVVPCTRDRNHAVISTDPEDLAALDPTLPIVVR